MARNETLERLHRGELNPLQAARTLDKEIGGITAIFWKQGLSIQNHTKRLSIDTRGLTKKQETRLQECATLCYWLAQQSGSLFPGELHFGKGLSTKHYAENFRTYTHALLTHYTTERGEGEQWNSRN